MNRAFHQLCTQPEGLERRALIAERNCLAEGVMHARVSARNEIRLYKRLKRKLAAANAKLRGEL